MSWCVFLGVSEESEFSENPEFSEIGLIAGLLSVAITVMGGLVYWLFDRVCSEEFVDCDDVCSGVREVSARAIRASRVERESVCAITIMDILYRI